MDSAPPLVIDLAVPILVTALSVCLHPVKPNQRRNLVSVQHATNLLNVLSRKADALQVSYAALLRMPWITAEVACRLGDLWLLHTLHSQLTCPPFSRPWQYHEPHALAAAARGGHVHVLAWLAQHVGLPNVYLEAYLVPACANNHLTVLEWWMQQGVPVKLGPAHHWALQWWKNKGMPVETGPNTTRALAVAGGRGHVAILTWWTSTFGMPALCDNACIQAAIANGRLHVLEWWEQLGVPIAFDEALAMHLACKQGHLAIMDWIAARRQQGSLEVRTDCIARAVFDNQHEVVAWFVQRAKDKVLLADQIHDIFPKGLVIAVMLKNKAMVDLLLSVVPAPLTIEPLAFACATGDVEWIETCQESAQAAHALGFVKHPASISLAAAFGHVHVIHWLYAHDGTVSTDRRWPVGKKLRKWWGVVPRLVDIDARFAAVFRSSGDLTPFLAACAGGSIAALDWITDWTHHPLDQLSEQDRIDGTLFAGEHGHKRVLEWLESHGWMPALWAHDAMVQSLFASATGKGDIGILEWLACRVNDYPNRCYSNRAIFRAVQGGHVAGLQWWHDRRAPVVDYWTLSFALDKGHLAAVQWLDDRLREYQQQGKQVRLPYYCRLRLSNLLAAWLRHRGIYDGRAEQAKCVRHT